MKKTLLIVAVAAMLVLMFAGSAFAGPNHSGTLRIGQAAVKSATTQSLKGTDGLTGTALDGAGTYTYVDWSNYLYGSTNQLSVSPHGNYTTTTIKCAVCHAVHYAAPGNSDPAGLATGIKADTLLRMQAVNACAYCHASTGTSVNGTPVYNGNFAAAVAASGGGADTGHALNEDGMPACSMCHSSVHGSGADNSIPSIRGLMLSLTPGPTQTGGVPDPMTPVPGVLTQITTANSRGSAQTLGSAVTGYTTAEWSTGVTSDYRHMAVGIFCAECHAGSYANGIAGATTNGVGGTTLTSGHLVGNSAVPSKGIGQEVAFAPATTCSSCHDAKDDFGNTAFPHAWGKTAVPAKMWLMSAANSVVAPTAAGPAGAAANSGFNLVARYRGATEPAGAGAQLFDGVCLKCHVSGSNSNSGVGVSF